MYLKVQKMVKCDVIQRRAVRGPVLAGYQCYMIARCSGGEHRTAKCWPKASAIEKLDAWEHTKASRVGS